MLLCLISCQRKTTSFPSPTIYVEVLGVAQDAGYPQADCRKLCCKKVWENEKERNKVCCLGIIDQNQSQSWLIDATPDIKDQLYQITERKALSLEGIFLTHAHIGHYTGLMHLGREAMGAKELPVYAMPRMVNFLTTNGPWSQLVDLKNILLNQIESEVPVIIGQNLMVTPFEVPHRDEFSETVGYKIQGPNKTLMFIPDIDKWHRWDKDINEEIRKVDYALIDGTFYKNGELKNRDMSQIPHPFVEESIRYFSSLSEKDKAKIFFIHLNHTNPILWDDRAKKEVEGLGFRVAKEGMKFIL